MIDAENIMKVECMGIDFKNPVIAASGTFGFGNEYRQYYDPSIFGGISTKGLTLEKRSGNKGRRIMETSGGVMNSIGLENPGIRTFLKEGLIEMKDIDTVIMANLGGFSLEDYQKGAMLIQQHNDEVDSFLKRTDKNTENGAMIHKRKVDIIELKSEYQGKRNSLWDRS